MAIKAEEPETIAPSLFLPRTPSPKKRTKPKSEDDESPRKRVPTKIPTSIEEASEEDKMLFRMRSEDEKPWAEISKAWEDITGEKTGISTLRMRYAKLKANFTVWNEDDASRLLQIGNAIEAEFEREKYGRMAKALAEGGGGTYDAGAVQKKYKELIKEAGL